MLHLERIRGDIVALGRRAALEQARRQEALELAHQWWLSASDTEHLRRHVQPLTLALDRWDGAVPCTGTPISAQIPCPDSAPNDLTVIGADGSQIFPDRHALVLYYLLQVGAVIFRYTGEAPDTDTREWLHYDERELYDRNGYLIGSDTLGMERTVKEMEVLADITAQERKRSPARVLSLTDGPLLWPYLERGHSASAALQAYLSALRGVQQSGGVAVGYVDRPGGRPLLELLWADQLAPEDLASKAGDNPLSVLTDYDLMAHSLAPGARTTWFTRPTATNQRHAGEGQEVWFYYLNLSLGPGDAIARIEVPAWAAADETAMTALHGALRHQASVLNGYPYILARAHEEALVTTQDKTALEAAIQRELAESGIFAQPSEKARQKLLLGRR